jgi:pimeloyl-ACP methyl ester carboxylesterase
MDELTLRDGEKLAFEVTGTGSTILLVMGTGADHSFWAAQVPELSRRHRVVTYDSRGTGASGDFARVEDGSAEALAADAAELLQHVGGVPAHVHGLSLGSVVAQELALARPELVRSLGLHATWGESDPWFVRMVESMEHALRDGGLASFIRGATCWILSPEFHATHAETIAGMEAAYASRAAARVDGVLAHCHADKHVATLSRLGSLRVPALVTAGELDIQVPQRYGRAVAAAVPGARFHLFTGPGSSHCACFERAADWNRVVLEFTAEVEGA